MSIRYYHKLLPILLLVFTMVGTGNFIQAQDAAEAEAVELNVAAGEQLYKGNCASCHKVHAKLIGPALAGVTEKYESEWLYKWIKNSQAFIKTGDERANAIYNEYNQSVMTAFPTLSNADIDNILGYINTVPVPVADAGVAVAGGGDASEAGFAWTPTNIFLVIMTVLLLAMVFILGRVLGTLGNISREKRGLEAKAPFTAKSLLSNKPFLATACLAVFTLLAYTTYDTTADINRMQGYQPEQPIKFSHKLHAGQWGIECQYCHSGAAKGKSAVIPSLNVCMNCHKQIQEGPQHGETEINKIYDYVGFDKETGKYDESKQHPIQWDRIHNLPDHVYFNHSQHVAVGKVECQTCHGEIQEMEVVEQVNSLGMGWCIDCHRETNVNFASNDYYNIYESYHLEMKEGKRSEVKVADIGGLECQKCHY